MSVRIARLLRQIGPLARPVGWRDQLFILIYHDVLPSADPLRPEDPDVAQFDQQMAAVSACFNVLPLLEAVERLDRGTLPPSALSITFDDGYAGSYLHGLPVLRRYGLVATYFIAPGYLDGGRMWNDTVLEGLRLMPSGQLDMREAGLGVFPIDGIVERLAAARAILGAARLNPPSVQLDIARLVESKVRAPLPNDLMMSSEAVVELRRVGMEIGSHTEHHPILSCVSRKTAHREMRAGRERLEALLGERVPLFAYPVGLPGRDLGREHVALARELGFKAAVTTQWGIASAAMDPHLLPRFTPWDRHPLLFALRLLYKARAFTAANRVRDGLATARGS
jgi:peptidoglycan/xylan/chitin deacetylase (PgdA/CDA1 family)